MSEKARKRYEDNKNEGSKTVADQQIDEPGHDTTEPKAQVKAIGPQDREEGSGLMANDYRIQSIAKENNNTSTKNHEAKLRSTSDKEC
jgi:hypothetical protein